MWFLYMLIVAVLSRGPGEAKDLAWTAYVESRYNALAESHRGACGMFQARAKFVEDPFAKWIAGGDEKLRRRITCFRLKVDPVFAVTTAIGHYRSARVYCGLTREAWRCCYRSGPNHEVCTLYRRASEFQKRLRAAGWR
jgi:hypothetical protein